MQDWISPCLGHELVSNLIQIAREGLSNVVQHASAQHVTVELHYGGDSVQLFITDDGVGMPSSAMRRSGHDGQGIKNMEERAQLIGGTFFIETAPGEGVRLKVTVPCNCVLAGETRQEREQ